MNNEDGKIWYGLGIDNTGLQADANKSSAIIRGIGTQATSDLSRMDSGFNALGVTIAGALGGASLISFGRSLIDITGKFQTFEAVLTNTLNSPEQARSAMLMLQDFAATTPFQVDGLTGAFVKLANQGFVPTMAQMVKLGDLASSTGKDFDQLAEAVIDAQVGEFERLKEFGIRASKEGDKVTFTFKEQATQVDFTSSAIQDYILSLGELQGVQGSNAAIAKTLTGQMSNLEDVITQTMNEIGQSSEGVLSGAISGAAYLVENYEKIGRVLGVLIASYGAYKAALMAVAAYHKVMALAQTIQQFNQMTSALRRTTQAQILLNKAVGANPYVKLASILLSVGGLIWAFAKNSEDAAEKQDKLNDSVKDAVASVNKEQVELDLLFNRLKNAKKGTEEYASAKNAIQSKYGHYLNNMSEEIRSLNDIAGAYALISQKAIQAARDRAISEATSQSAANYAQKEIATIEKMVGYFERGGLSNDQATTAVSKIIGAFRQGAEITDKQKKEADTYLRKTFEDHIAYGAGRATADGTEVYDFWIGGLLSSLSNSKGALDKEILSINKLMSAGLNPTSTQGSPSYSESYLKAQTEWNEAKKAYDSIVKDKETTVEDFNKASERVKGAEEAFQALGGSTKETKVNPLTDEEKVLIKNSIDWYEEEIKKLKELKGSLTDAGEIAKIDTQIEGHQESINYLDGTEARAAKQKRDEELREQQEHYEALKLEYEEYFQARERVEAEYAAKRKMFYVDGDESKGLKDDATQGNVDNLNEDEQNALSEIDELFAMKSDEFVNWSNEIAALSIEQLEEAIRLAKEKIAELEKDNPNSKDLAKARAALAKAEGALGGKQSKAAKEAKDNTKPIVESWKDLEEQLNDCASAFQSIGDEIGGVAGEIISDVGSIATSTLSVISGITQLVSMSAAGMQTTATTASAAIQTVEKASVILAIISAVIQVAMKIASLFNKDDDYQENIERLQGEIDNLELELQNRDIVKMREKGLVPLIQMRDLLKEMTQEVVNQYMEAGKLNSIWGFIKHNAEMSAEIQRRAAEEMAKSYANISYSDSNLFGEELYKDANEQIQNMAQQQLLIQQQIDNEKSKKSKNIDHGQIAEWERQIEELGAEAVQIINEAFEGIMGGSAMDWANDLGNAMFDAAKKGEDGMVAWGEKTKDIVGDIMKQLLIQQVLMPEIMKIFDKYKSKWFKDNQFVGFDAILNDMPGLYNELNGLYGGFAGALEGMPDTFKDILGFTEEQFEREASSMGKETASQESVDESNGRLTVIQGHTYNISDKANKIADHTERLVRANEAILDRLSGIEANTAHCSRLEQIQADMNAVKTGIEDINTKGITIKR